jgi:hypothetical protein
LQSRCGALVSAVSRLSDHICLAQSTGAPLFSPPTLNHSGFDL